MTIATIYEHKFVKGRYVVVIGRFRVGQRLDLRINRRR